MLSVLWRRTPHIQLTRFPQIFIAIAAAAAILSAIAASGQLFLASSETASLAREISESSRYQAGLRINTVAYAQGDEATLDALLTGFSAVLDEEVLSIDHLDPAVVSIMGPNARATSPSDEDNVRLIHRAGAFDHVELIEGGSRDGAWIADTTAMRLGLEVGDSMTIAEGPTETDIRVRGIYRFLPEDEPRDFWRSLDAYIYKAPGDDTFPFAFVLLPRATMLDLVHQGFGYDFVRWEYAIDTADLSLPEATVLTQRFDGIAQSLVSSQGTLSEALSERGNAGLGARADADSSLHGIVSTATDRLESVTPVVDLLSFAAGGVALSLMAAAGFFLVKRRRVEVAGLAARGVGPISQGARYGVESLPPLVLGGLLGPLLSYGVVVWLGPAGALPPAAMEPAIAPVVAALGAGWILLGLSAAFSVAREERALSSPPHDVAGVRWLLLLAAVVGTGTALLYRWLERRDHVAVDDPAATAFPVLAAALAGVFATTILKIVLAAIAPRLRRRFPPGYLAARRLAGASTLTHVLVIAGVSALGMMLYGVTMSSSVEESVTSKAAVFVGSDFSTLVGSNFSIDLPYEHTVVRTLPRVTLEPGPRIVRMLGIDTEGFADVALWKEAFAPAPIDELMDLLEGGATTAPKVIVAGDPIPDGTAISVSGTDVPIDVVATATSFPGMANEGSTIIMNNDSFDETASRMAIYSQPTLWVKGDTEGIEAALLAANANSAPPRTVESVIQSPEIQSALGILGVLSALGAAAGIVVVVGLLLYLQARHRATVVSSALTRRMGLGRSQEFRAWFWEITGALFLSFAAAALIALPVAAIMNPRLDPRPDLAPEPTLVIPSLVVVLVGIGVLLVALVAAWRIQRGIDHTDVAQEMRS